MNKIIVLSLIFWANTLMNAQNKLDSILLNGEDASKHHFYQTIYDNYGNYSSIPISIIKGAEKGPVFTIISGVHGVEYSSIIATHELLQEFKPELLSGTIIVIPLANPNSFYSRSPFLNPQDRLNLNRVFPGKQDGSITEKIAHFITTKIIAKSDLFIDIHGGDANEDLLSFIGYYRNNGQAEATEKIKKLAEASGFKYVVSWPYNLTKDQAAKYAFKQAIQDGKLALTIEAGKLGNVQTEAVQLIKDGIYNILNESHLYKKDKKSIQKL